MVPQACATSSIPRSELREVSRLHSSPEKTLLGSMRATAGMAAPLPPYYAWTPSRSIGGAGDDVNLGGQRPVHRAFVGDFDQLLALLGIQRALHGDGPFDLVEQADLGVAFGAILCMDLALFQRHGDAVERQRFSLGIQSQGHGSTGAEAGKQQVVWA